MRKIILCSLALVLAAPALAGGRIKTLQKRIQKDRRDILYHMTRIRDSQARLKKDQAKAREEGETGPEGKWSSRAAKETIAIDQDRTAQQKAQKDLGEAQAELDRILAKGTK